MEIAVKNIQGEETGRSVTLEDSIFGVEPNDHAIYLDVKQYMANQRQGTHKAKERAEIAGSTRKIKRQKGTGTARAGSIKSPIFRGGGRIFGPRPRNYGFKLNKKVKQLARKSALSYKAKDNQITVLEAFNFDAPKTKNYLGLLSTLSLQNGKSLLVLDSPDRNIALSARNLPNAKVVTANKLNTYEILDARHLIMSEEAVKTLKEMYDKKANDN
ncbi:50S ribosomal protein L4 [Tunicatimonas pelagia]|uniref:50S ribosomal protein L4 n=1 Tax=Tunicatimonas pelagia TaxID=931531 RepID=UPI002666FC64|nr:50S ribosomal protein L4 [Tunicatimonas pelagia]WKN42254.1 50S ribosomal protein L4 [Tunicatimonas pelagia]